MIRLFDIRAATLAMLAIALAGSGLAWFIRGSALVDPQARPLASWSPSLGDPVPAAPAVSNPDMAEVLERPLFRLPREPYVAIVEMAPAPPPPAPVLESVPQPMPAALQQPQFGLSGIAVIGEKQQALVTTAEEPQGQWIAVGDSVQEWQVTAITPVSVTLKTSTQEITLELYVDKTNETVGTLPPPQ